MPMQAGCHVNVADLNGAYAPHATREPLAAMAIGASLYCICRRPVWPGVEMTCCDVCTEWYHNNCVGIHTPLTEQDSWTCPVCQGHLNYPNPNHDRDCDPNPDPNCDPNCDPNSNPNPNLITNLIPNSNPNCDLRKGYTFDSLACPSP